MKKIFTLICLALFVAGKVSAQLPTLTVTTTGASNCTAPCDGLATAATQTITGMSFVWNTTPPQLTNTATGLCPGVYTCTVTLSPFGSTTGTGTVTCTANGVNNITYEENVNLFPNPAHQELNIELDHVLHGSVTINIRNILGIIVYQESLEGSAQTQIDISELPVGIYDVELLNGNSITRQKFVKQ